jgi:uncharacterized protein (TIGR01777 family)
MKKIVIAGGSGFIGKYLTSYFENQKYSIVILTRGSSKTIGYTNYINWDAKNIGAWTKHLENTDVLINLVGKSVDCRYTEANKNEILASRVNATNVLGQAINDLKTPPKVWINSSTATIYAGTTDQPNDEANGVIGNDFSMSVAQAWEKSLAEANTPTTRKIALRISLVLGRDGGVLPVLVRNAKMLLGGYQGNGLQKFAWIHIEDVARIINFIIENENIEGPVNCTANHMINNKEFNATLRKFLKITFGLNTPKPLLKLGCFILRTEPELILKSRYVIPKKLIDLGFSFNYKTIEKALNELTSKPTQHGYYN